MMDASTQEGLWAHHVNRVLDGFRRPSMYAAMLFFMVPLADQSGLQHIDVLDDVHGGLIQCATSRGLRLQHGAEQHLGVGGLVLSSAGRKWVILNVVRLSGWFEWGAGSACHPPRCRRVNCWHHCGTSAKSSSIPAVGTAAIPVLTIDMQKRGASAKIFEDCSKGLGKAAKHNDPRRMMSHHEPPESMPFIKTVVTVVHLPNVGGSLELAVDAQEARFIGIGMAG
jgi:hypothetical protein